MTAGRSRRTIYLASPLTTFRTQRYDRMRDYCAARFDGHVLLEPRYLFDGNADWLRKWTDIPAGIDQLVFFHDGAPDWIGRGVAREVDDARDAGKSVWYLDDGGTFHPLARTLFTTERRATSKKFARVLVWQV